MTLTLLHSGIKTLEGWWRWALVSPDGVAPSQMVVCLPLLIFPCTMKCSSSLLALAHLCGPGKRAIKRLWLLWCGIKTLLMNTPYKLFVNSANMAQEYVQIIATENSITTNGRQHMPE